MVDVPLHIKNPPSIQQNVRIEGGTNWDLSRSAVPTPIQVLPEPEPDAGWVHESVAPEPLPKHAYSPADGIPLSTPTLQRFSVDSAVVGKSDQKTLKALSKKLRYTVVGHAAEPERSAATLSWQRANNVAAILRRSGHTVASVKAFGNQKPRGDTDAESQRVEIYAAGAVK